MYFGLKYKEVVLVLHGMNVPLQWSSDIYNCMYCGQLQQWPVHGPGE